MYNPLKISHILLSTFSLALLLSSCSNSAKSDNTKDLMKMEESKTVAPQKVLRHVVLFNFNDKATPEIIKKIEKEFAALRNKINEIHDFEWGINNSPEGLDKGLTHCFLISFLSEKDRSIYLPHPAHQNFVSHIEPYIEDVTVVDYWTD